MVQSFHPAVYYFLSDSVFSLHQPQEDMLFSQQNSWYWRTSVIKQIKSIGKLVNASLSPSLIELKKTKQNNKFFITGYPEDFKHPFKMKTSLHRDGSQLSTIRMGCLSSLWTVLCSVGPLSMRVALDKTSFFSVRGKILFWGAGSWTQCSLWVLSGLRYTVILGRHYTLYNLQVESLKLAFCFVCSLLIELYITSRMMNSSLFRWILL